MGDYYKNIGDGSGGSVPEHRVLAERALGRPLPKGVEVHHVNEDKRDNSPGNLVICEDTAYHNLLHQRRTALLACGHVAWSKCQFCGEWGADVVRYGARTARHRHCYTEYQRNRRKSA